jgi:hypothetical protein
VPVALIASDKSAVARPFNDAIEPLAGRWSVESADNVLFRSVL